MCAASGIESCSSASFPELSVSNNNKYLVILACNKNSSSTILKNHDIQRQSKYFAHAPIIPQECSITMGIFFHSAWAWPIIEGKKFKLSYFYQHQRYKIIVIFSSFDDADPSHSMLVDCCMLCHRECRPMAAVGWLWPPWSINTTIHLVEKLSPLAPFPSPSSPLSVIGHGISGGNYLAKCRDSPSSQSLMCETTASRHGS